MMLLEIASQGPPSLVYPALIAATYIHRTNTPPELQERIVDEDTIGDGATVRLGFLDGTSVCEQDALHYFMKMSCAGSDNSRVSWWIQRADLLATSNYRQLQSPLEELNVHLTLRTYIVGYEISLIDAVVWAAVASNHIAVSSIRKTQNNVTRWYTYIEASEPWISDELNGVKSAAAKARAASRAAASAAGANYNIDLPDITGPITTRLPPEPSGYLHIGHAKAALLNEYFARLREGGQLICRFDDTNPTNERAEFQESILQDLKLLEIFPDQITHSSDYFQTMYEVAIKLINEGKAFADDSELGKGDELRRNRLPSRHRNMSIEETLRRFAEMKTGSDEGQRWALRARIAYDSPNGTLRDPVIYRCNTIPHHRTGVAWKIYPTYDFCAPILDSIEGVSVALRTNEYRDRNAQYAWMQNALGLRSVPLWDFSRLNFVRTVLSKRKLTRIVNDGRVWGWDDPRMPTIRGILRRGQVVPALQEFILKQGPSRNVVNMEWDSFWAMNRKYIDPAAQRHTAIAALRAVPCFVEGVEGFSVEMKPKHPKNPLLGEKQVAFGPRILLEQADATELVQHEEITLMNWGNAFVRHISRGENGFVNSVSLELNLEGDYKKTKRKVTWLADSPDNLTPVDLISFDHLITKDKLEKHDKLEDFLTSTSEFRTEAYADCNVAGLELGAIIQFERKGFYRLDAAHGLAGSRAWFFEVPDK